MDIHLLVLKDVPLHTVLGFFCLFLFFLFFACCLVLILW